MTTMAIITKKIEELKPEDTFLYLGTCYFFKGLDKYGNAVVATSDHATHTQTLPSGTVVRVTELKK